MHHRDTDREVLEFSEVRLTTFPIATLYAYLYLQSPHCYLRKTMQLQKYMPALSNQLNTVPFLQFPFSKQPTIPSTKTINNALHLCV